MGKAARFVQRLREEPLRVFELVPVVVAAAAKVGTDVNPVVVVSVLVGVLATIEAIRRKYVTPEVKAKAREAAAYARGLDAKLERVLERIEAKRAEAERAGITWR